MVALYQGRGDAVYKRPGWIVRHIANGLVTVAVAMGLSPRGAQILAVRGRTSGKWRTTPVNPLPFEGQRFLVAPRGETHWARNLRAAGEAELRQGRMREAIRVAAVADADKPAVIRAYLDRWSAETASHFGLGKAASDAEIAAVAPDRPVFRILG